MQLILIRDLLDPKPQPLNPEEYIRQVFASLSDIIVIHDVRCKTKDTKNKQKIYIEFDPHTKTTENNISEKIKEAVQKTPDLVFHSLNTRDIREIPHYFVGQDNAHQVSASYAFSVAKTMDEGSNAEPFDPKNKDHLFKYVVQDHADLRNNLIKNEKKSKTIYMFVYKDRVEVQVNVIKSGITRYRTELDNLNKTSSNISNDNSNRVYLVPSVY